MKVLAPKFSVIKKKCNGQTFSVRHNEMFNEMFKVFSHLYNELVPEVDRVQTFLQRVYIYVQILNIVFRYTTQANVVCYCHKQELVCCISLIFSVCNIQILRFRLKTNKIIYFAVEHSLATKDRIKKKHSVWAEHLGFSCCHVTEHIIYLNLFKIKLTVIHHSSFLPCVRTSSVQNSRALSL